MGVLPQPQTKADRLIRDINRMVLNGRDEVSMMRIRTDVVSLEKASYGDAKRVLGMLAALDGDLTAVETQFTAAIRHGANPNISHFNYATALSNLHYMIRAIEMVEKNLEFVENDPDYLETAFGIYGEAFHIDGMRKVRAQLQKLDREDILGEMMLAKYESLVSLYDNHPDLNWITIAERIDMAAETIRDHGILIRRNTHFISDGSFYYSFELEADVDQVIQLEDEITERICEMPYSLVDDVICISCSCVSAA